MGLAIVPEISALLAEPIPERPHACASESTKESAEVRIPPLGPHVRIDSDEMCGILNEGPLKKKITLPDEPRVLRNESRGEEPVRVDWGETDLGDCSDMPGEIVEIDERDDPPAMAPENLSEECNYESLLKLKVRSHVTRSGEMLRAAVRETLREMNQTPTLSEKDVAADELFLQEIEEHILDAERFVAGSFQNNLAAWEELLSGSSRQLSRKVLKWIRDGVQPIFDGTQSTNPAKMRRVRSFLRRAVPKDKVEEFLSGKLPHEIEFQNHQSVYDHYPFTVKAVNNLVITGTAHLYSPGEGKPKVVNPLGVALNSDKERLVLNGIYINSYMQDLPFRYERLRDILTFLQKGGFISSWDLKSGYFHVLIHPKYRTYFGFQIGGAYLHFNGVCFGWKQPCYVFTVVMQEVFLEVRARSIPVLAYIDDGITADPSYEKCLWSVVRVVKLLDLLGAYFGIPKCRFRPSQEGEWLGFELVSRDEQFRVSSKKMKRVLAVLARLISTQEVTPRQLAAVAGKLISLAPAVLPASLYSREFFQAIQGKISWDAIFPTSNSVKREAQEWINNLPRWNGRKWHAQPISVTASPDASDFGYGGLIQLPDGKKVPVFGNLSEQEVLSSSTARESVAFLKLLEATCELYPGHVSNSSVQLTGDNQAAVLAFNEFRTRTSEVNRTLKRVFDLCVKFKFSVSAVWKPRDLLKMEDLLSREPDSSDWGLSEKLVGDICKEFQVNSVLDLFASSSWHVTDKFVSLVYTPGCVGAQALALDWRALLQPGKFAWIFPPVRHIAEVVQRIERFQTNCIVILPERKASNWWIRMHQWTIAQSFSRIDIPRGTHSCRPSRRVPANTANPGLFKLRVFRIQWI